MAHFMAGGKLHNKSLHVSYGGQAQQWKRCLSDALSKKK